MDDGQLLKHRPNPLPDVGLVGHVPELVFGVPVEFGHLSQLLVEVRCGAVGLESDAWLALPGERKDVSDHAEEVFLVKRRGQI